MGMTISDFGAIAGIVGTLVGVGVAYLRIYVAGQLAENRVAIIGDVAQAFQRKDIVDLQIGNLTARIAALESRK